LRWQLRGDLDMAWSTRFIIRVVVEKDKPLALAAPAPE
jgi:hypothetical protein